MTTTNINTNTKEGASPPRPVTPPSDNHNSSSNVRVAVRIRPLTSTETSQGGKSAIRADPLTRQVGVATRRQFTYDMVFDQDASQEVLYRDVSKKLLGSFLDGYNATIMAYGQTGSGKTFSMGSEAHNTQNADSSSIGLIPRFMSDIFSSLQRQTSDNSNTATNNPYQITASFLEVYGEDVYDLLSPEHTGSSRPSLPLREDTNGEITVTGLKTLPIRSSASALQILHEGTLQRTTAATLMNHSSSRSHAVFTIYLTQTESVEGSEQTSTRTSRFTFVDLAGSERLKKTKAEGERAREGIKINEGLLALGNVINALADEDRLAKGNRPVHVPYRQSKLTRLLQDALGGNSQTLFLACVSPSDTNVSESMSTLQYANRARNIRNEVRKNVDPAVVEMRRLGCLCEVLRSEVLRVKFGEGGENMMERDDVKEYFDGLLQKAEKRGAEMTNTGGIGNDKASSNFFSLSSSSSSSSTPITPIVNNNNNYIPITTSTKIDNPPSSPPSDPSLNLLEINPDEDMAILDQLLELQHHDTEFQQSSQSSTLQLDQVAGELEEQEILLQKLRSSLQNYQNLKQNYEALAHQVSALESERSRLAKELTQQDDPKKCRTVIKTRLKKVEEALSRARSETRQHQKMYRKAEAEVQRVRALEHKICDLKRVRVTLQKKQKSDLKTHREFTLAKTKEIRGLKRREGKIHQEKGKLIAECRRQKVNLQKRKDYSDKLSGKLKQTETHLMRLLKMRKKDLESGRKKTIRGGGHQSKVSPSENHPADTRMAPQNEEISSIRFLLSNMVGDRVSRLRLERCYASRVTEYGECMRLLVKEVKILKESGESEETLLEHEQNVEELELKIELIGADLEEMRERLPEDDEEGGSTQDGNREEETAKTMILNLSGSMTRTLLWDILENLTKSEFERENMEETIKRKESALISLETEVVTLEQKLKSLSEGYEKHRTTMARMSTLSKSPTNNDTTPRPDENYDPYQAYMKLEEEAKSLRTNISEIEIQRDDALKQIQLREAQLTAARTSYAEIIEQNRLTEVPRENEEAARNLRELQSVWKRTGVPLEYRETIMSDIGSALEDTCANKLEDGLRYVEELQCDISKKDLRLRETYRALGWEEVEIEGVLNREELDSVSRLKCLEILEEQQVKIRPLFVTACERRESIIAEVEAIVGAMELSVDVDTSDDIRTVLSYKGMNNKMRRRAHHHHEKHEITISTHARKERIRKMKDIDELLKALDPMNGDQKINDGDSPNSKIVDDEEHEGDEITDEHNHPNNKVNDKHHPNAPNSLSDSFLTNCEKEVKRLRHVKSSITLCNTDTVQKGRALVQEMNLTKTKTHSLLSQITPPKDARDAYSWWESNIAEQVSAIISGSHAAIVGVSPGYTRHLNFKIDKLQKIVGSRHKLSDKLRTVVEGAHSNLLLAVEGEADASEAYASFHEALFRDSPVSREHIKACVDEIDILVDAAEAMSESEIEALMVVWEALGIRKTDRDAFWKEVEGLTASESAGVFDEVFLGCEDGDVETWLRSAVEIASEAQRVLNMRLIKLSAVHDEVKKQRAKQDVKSKIMSLDSDICILGAQLADFEEKASNKQRLLSKKMGSMTLLQEERFRKQMQSKFTFKLESLGSVLQEWSRIGGGSNVDENMLSDDVRIMLGQSDNLEEWVERRTAFMHLKTTKPKHRLSVASGIETTEARGKSKILEKGDQASLPPPPPTRKSPKKAPRVATEARGKSKMLEKGDPASLPPPPPTRKSPKRAPRATTEARGKSKILDKGDLVSLPPPLPTRKSPKKAPRADSINSTSLPAPRQMRGVRLGTNRRMSRMSGAPGGISKPKNSRLSALKSPTRMKNFMSPRKRSQTQVTKNNDSSKNAPTGKPTNYRESSRKATPTSPSKKPPSKKISRTEENKKDAAETSSANRRASLLPFGDLLGHTPAKENIVPGQYQLFNKF